MAFWFGFLIITASSPWTWQLCNYNWMLGLLVILVGGVGYQNFLKLTMGFKQIKLAFLVNIGLLIISLWQIYISLTGYPTQAISTPLSPTLVQQHMQRYAAYPKLKFELGPMKVEGSLARIWEINPAVPVLANFKNNLSAVVDPNYYFFAGHPRESEAKSDKERFWFIWLPVWLIGIVHIFEHFPLLKWQLCWWLGLPVVTSVVFGSPQSVGAVAIWPVMVVVMALGWQQLITAIIKLGEGFKPHSINSGQAFAKF